MEALSSLGIDWKILIAQIINFLILLFVLSKLLYKPLVGMLEQRKEKIAQGIADSKAAEQRLAQSEEEASKTINGAIENANSIVEKASAEAVREVSKMIEDAKKQSAQLIEMASDNANKKQEEIMQGVRTKIADIIEVAVEKIIAERPSSESINKAIKELK